jgi:hypothetical protein
MPGPGRDLSRAFLHCQGLDVTAPGPPHVLPVDRQRPVDDDFVIRAPPAFGLLV